MLGALRWWRLRRGWRRPPRWCSGWRGWLHLAAGQYEEELPCAAAAAGTARPGADCAQHASESCARQALPRSRIAPYCASPRHDRPRAPGTQLPPLGRAPRCVSSIRLQAGHLVAEDGASHTGTAYAQRRARDRCRRRSTYATGCRSGISHISSRRALAQASANNAASKASCCEGSQPESVHHVFCKDGPTCLPTWPSSCPA